MRASINWLKNYVEITETPEELANMLTMAGVPVESIDYLGQDIEGVVTGKIRSIDPHLNADKLLVCKVDVGSETLSIVTGATNIRTGDIVPVAKGGAKLPGGKTIEDTDIRGVASKGMLCSTQELNIDNKLVSAEARNGIFILPEDTPVGTDIRQALGLDDIVLEFELTANRGDCFSMIGLAREIAALTGRKLKKPMLNLKEAADEKVQDLAEIIITNPDLCSRFAARIFKDVKIKQSPAWLRKRIFAAGMRPINNVVDVTNFVMLEMGQPLHAYDYNLLSRHTLMVRSAYPGEKLTTLDDARRQLTPEMTVIADQVNAVGLAGVMGGLTTEVTSNTKNIILEAAAFKGPNIRRTSRELGLRSEASGRFERGVDVVELVKSLDRAAQLLEEMDACQVCPGIIDVYPQIQLPKQITFTPKQINDHLGTNIDSKTMIDFLERLGFQVEAKNKPENESGEKITATVPTWRLDVTCMADISEEIARLYGYDNIPSTTPVINMAKANQSYEQTIVDQVKETLTGLGFCETLSFSFSHPKIFDKLNIASDSLLRNAIEVLNPITDDFPVLRTTLLGNLMETVAANLARKNDNLKVYEIGTVYLAESLPLKTFPQEPVILCGALTGRREKTGWNQSAESVDFYDAKGMAETILEKLGIINYESVSENSLTLEHFQTEQSLPDAWKHPSLHPGKSALLLKDGDILGYIGEVHPAALDSFNIDRKVYVFELSIEQLTKHAVLTGKYRPVPKFPAISRDLAVILPNPISHQQVKKAIINSAGQLLESVELFDVYVGKQVPEGAKSLAFSLKFRACDRTLTDDEIDGQYKRIITYLEENVSAKLRM